MRASGFSLNRFITLSVLLACTPPAFAINRFVQRNLVANDAAYCPTAGVSPDMRNAWAVAIRPAGAGGHFWVTTNVTGESLEYVGDVGGVPLHTDSLARVDVPGPGHSVGTPTGVVFNQSTGFVVTQNASNGPITAPAKFLFVTDTGTISAWVERLRGDGGYDRPHVSRIVVDRSAQGSQFFGLGLSNLTRRLFVADFGTRPQVRVFDANFAEITAQVPLQNPFVGPAGPKPGDFVPFNVQVLSDGANEHVFVMYTRSQEDPEHPGHILPGEEDSAPGHGRLVEYDTSGQLVAVWHDRGLLDSPWGVQYAPTGFGLGEHTLLVGNFGDGTITAFNAASRQARFQLQDPFGNPIRIDGLWGLQFGNGASLGEANHVYFGAGPNDETDGIFGKLLPQFPVTPESRAAVTDWMAQHERCTRVIDGQVRQASCAIPCAATP